jgi:hypothetical protein
MVVGRSDSGKSSLVYAGLLPALRRQRDRFWNVLSFRPGPEPLRSLAAAFNPRADDEGAAAYAAKIGDEAASRRATPWIGARQRASSIFRKLEPNLLPWESSLS